MLGFSYLFHVYTHAVVLLIGFDRLSNMVTCLDSLMKAKDSISIQIFFLRLERLGMM